MKFIDDILSLIYRCTNRPPDLTSRDMIVELYKNVDDKELKKKVEDYIHKLDEVKDMRVQVTINGKVIAENYLTCIDCDDNDITKDRTWQRGSNFPEEITLQELGKVMPMVAEMYSLIKHVREHRAKESGTHLQPW